MKYKKLLSKPYFNKVLIVIVLTLILAFTLMACSQNTTQDTVNTARQEKLYQIKVYSCPFKYVPDFNKQAERENVTVLQLIKFVIENQDRNEITKNIYNILSIDIYYAKEIKDFSETTVRFIDYTGKEQFISADYIEVEQR